ncbi:hypothetical protein CERSUDRAFT_109817 [Gelatoporia subvermispora B]|uniref:F-box domain-containing protein n=1 Tax=Ceriporiopsis subvermispora (strain B) TaxID=914234 RepID=M2RQN0_CERS8|nr:hypothetical protein CERSUDRAFT_109817 [Gelatoporia subvermispora B]
MSTSPGASSMSTAASLTNDQGILSEAGPNDVPGTDTSTNSSQMEEKYMGSEHQSGEDMCVYFPLRAGALPLELWWGILEIIDDPRALLACGCTCVAFRDAVRRVIDGLASQWIDRGMVKMQLAADPTSGYFLQRLAFWSHDFLSWMSTFPIPSPRLRTLNIAGLWMLQKTRHTLSLRFQTRLALSRLTTITHLELSTIHFSSFSDFTRLVCALPNLDTLLLIRVTVNDRGGSTLQGAYFARDLRLKELWPDRKLRIWRVAPDLESAHRPVPVPLPQVHRHPVSCQRSATSPPRTDRPSGGVILCKPCTTHHTASPWLVSVLWRHPQYRVSQRTLSQFRWPCHSNHDRLWLREFSTPS